MQPTDSPTIISKEALQELIQVQPENFTIVHCKLYVGYMLMFYRIWKSTFLIEDSGVKARLLHAYNISYYPEWHYEEPKNGYNYFTLVFEGLSRSCESFYLDEQIPEPGGFISDPIAKNKTDVYSTEIFTR